MPSVKAATGRRRVSGGSVDHAPTVSGLRRWVNRGALAFCTALLGFGLYQGAAYLGSSKLNA